MNQRAIILSVLLFTLIVVGMFLFTYLKQGEIKDTQTDTTASSTETATNDRYGNITRIDGKHFFIDGVHTVVGEIAMPTPCDLLETSAIVAESYPEQITLNFEVINNADFCAEVITPQRFKITATASASSTFSAVFKGRPVELNLVEALPGETPEDFELFIKG